MSVKEFYVSDYGAAGDGVTNDGYAISKAVKAASEYENGDKAVIFEAGKTYRILEIPSDNIRNCLFSLEKVNNLSIIGNGAKLLFKGKIKLLSLEFCRNFNFSGFNIDYSPKPFVLANVIGFDCDTGYIDFETNEDFGVEDELTPGQPCFAFPNRSDIRYHYFINGFKRLSSTQYRMIIGEGTIDRIKNVKIGDEFIIPHMGGSHLVGGACTLYDCDTFTISDLRFYSHPEFGFDVRCNTGKNLFKNIVLKQEEGSRVQLVSWRDCFHVKDNLDPIVWDNCYIGPIGDDAFNLSCVHLDVTDVAADARTIHCYPAEKGKTRPLEPGDEYIAYDIETGSYIGEGKAAKVFDSTEDVFFESDVALPKLKKGMQISFYKFANPGFVVKNSYIEGTVRVRSRGTFENCKFNVFWVAVENEFFVEGPVPKDVTFKDCTFTTFYDDSANIFHVGTLGKNGMHNCEYKCKNIVLENCSFLKGKIDVEEGNELFIR